MNNECVVIRADHDFCFVITCAFRYCLGRRTYAPHIFVEFVTPMLKYLDDISLACIVRDIEAADHSGDLGDPSIDRPVWISFKSLVSDEINNRKERNKDGNQ